MAKKHVARKDGPTVGNMLIVWGDDKQELHLAPENIEIVSLCRSGLGLLVRHGTQVEQRERGGDEVEEVVAKL